MACGITLKRTAHFDLLNDNSTKPVLDDNTAFDHCQPCRQKRRRLSVLAGCHVSSKLEPRVHEMATQSLHQSGSTSKPESCISSQSSSPFALSSSKACLSSEQVVRSVYEEYRRMKRRRHLLTKSSPDGTNSPSIDSFPLPPTNSIQLDPSDSSAIVHPVKCNTETPLLSLKQVGIICEQLLKEQNQRLCTEFETILAEKLADQYDTFVKFSQDQLQRRFCGETATYVS